MNIEYQTPGFGVVVILDNTNDLTMTEDAYLFKIGSSDFSIFKKHQNKQTLLSKNSSIITSSISNKNQHLIFEIIDGKAKMIACVKNLDGTEEDFILGEKIITGDLNNYYIGFYSSKGNVIKNISFEQPLPNKWKTNISNTDGGYISFTENSFCFENCLHDAEIEQDNIILQPGKYYLSFDTDKINNAFDIDWYVMKQILPDEFNESDFEDEKKNILNKDDNSFILNEETGLILKFRGQNGKISNISIHTNINGGYVETEDNYKKSDGSSIDINLSGVEKIEWKAIINEIPEYNDFTKIAPYGIISTYKKNYTNDVFNIILKKEYSYLYTVEDSILNVAYEDKLISSTAIELSDADNNILRIMFNMNAVIYFLKIYYKDGKTEDTIIQKDLVQYIPTMIYSPIVVRHKSTGESLDLSASYRQEVKARKKFKLITTKFFNGEIEIPGNIPDNAMSIKLYGLPITANINSAGKNIDEYANDYTLLDNDHYVLSKGVVHIEDKVLKEYPYIVLEYKDITDCSYVFTNFEREYFSILPGKTVRLSKNISKDNPSVLVYAIKKDSFFNPEYIYTIEPKSINALDYYCNDYDIISPESYEIDFKNNIVKFNSETIFDYDHLIIDYMKKDSYAINMMDEMAQYEVSISSDENDIEILYDIHEDGTSAEYITIAVSEQKDNNFIVLRKHGEDT